MMKRLLVTLAIVALFAAPAMAKDFTPWTGATADEPDQRADVVLEYDGGLDYLYGFGSSPGWTDLTVVNFEAPAGGPWDVAEAWYYVSGPNEKTAEIWAVGDLFAPPLGLGFDGILWTPVGPDWPPGDWTIVDITGYGLTLNAGELFGIGCDIYPDEGIGLCYAAADGNPGHTWAMYYGYWTDDTYSYDTDETIRTGLNGPPTAVDETTWGGVKALFQ